jgi:hypothetical protein
MPANPARLERDLLRQGRHEHRLMAPIVSLRELRQWGMGNNELRKIRDGGTIQGFLYLPQTGTVVLDAPADALALSGEFESQSSRALPRNRPARADVALPLTQRLHFAHRPG